MKRHARRYICQSHSESRVSVLFLFCKCAMTNQVVGNTFTWVIKNIKSLKSGRIYSDDFEIGGCKWRLVAYLKGNKYDGRMSLCLDVADSEYLPSGWKRKARFKLTVVNRKYSIQKENCKWFNLKNPASGFSTWRNNNKRVFKCDESLGDGDVKIVATIDVLKVFGQIDVVSVDSEEESEENSEVECAGESKDESEEESEMDPEEESEEESEEDNRPRKKTKRNDDDDAVSNASRNETMDVNGFQVLPSQVKLVRRIFKKYPDVASDYQVKNQHLRTACMNFLLGLIETLSKSPQKLSDEDLLEADNALAYVKDACFKVDWLDNKLEEVKKKKKDEQTSATRTKKLEKELKDVEQKCSNMEALLEKEKAKLVAVRAHQPLDDFI